MHIAEIFQSIQGESTLAGTPTLFIRCAGCNLSCSWCDTPYACSGGTVMDIDMVLREVTSSQTHTICITGGEPLLQPETAIIAHELCKQDYTVSIETNGTMPVSELPFAVKAVIDVKCPGSGEDGSFLADNINTGRTGDEYKFVLTDRDDFLYACSFVEHNNLAGSRTILFSPILSQLSPALLAEWIINEFPAARLNLQLQRFIWPDDTRSR